MVTNLGNGILRLIQKPKPPKTLASMMTGRFFSANSWATQCHGNLDHFLSMATDFVRLKELLWGNFMPFHLRTQGVRRFQHVSPWFPLLVYPVEFSWNVPREMYRTQLPQHGTGHTAPVAHFFEMKCSVMQMLYLFLKRGSRCRERVFCKSASPGHKPLELEVFARHRRSPASEPDCGRLNSVQSALRALRLEHHHFVRSHILPILS